MRQSESLDPPQAVAFMLPGYHGLYKIDLLVNHSHLHPRKSGGNHLEGK